MSYNYESETFEIKAPARENYTFAGWIYESTATPVKKLSITKGSHANLTLTANWIENTGSGGERGGSPNDKKTFQSDKEYGKGASVATGDSSDLILHFIMLMAGYSILLAGYLSKRRMIKK